jgi:hypothetical protein
LEIIKNPVLPFLRGARGDKTLTNYRFFSSFLTLIKFSKNSDGVNDE